MFARLTLAPVLLPSLLLACTTPATDDASTATSNDAGNTGAASSTSTGDAPTTATPTTDADTGTGTDGASGSTGAPLPKFVLDCHAVFTPDMRLALACNLPSRVRECTTLAVSDAPCDDLDLDGLVDEWEDLALARLHPVRRLDEDESLVGDPTAVLGDVGRVAVVGERIRLFVMLGYSLDYGSCGGFTGHNGDSERVALDLQPEPTLGPGGVVVVGAYTAAHENTSNDHGRVFIGDELTQLVYTPDLETGEPRWVVFPSADKHATYATVPICEDISLVPCIDEDCGPDGVDDASIFDRLPPIVNAGEEAAPRSSDLTELGFPGDDAWAAQDFCGGLGGTGCSAPVRDKLLADPFQ